MKPIIKIDAESIFFIFIQSCVYFIHVPDRIYIIRLELDRVADFIVIQNPKNLQKGESIMALNIDGSNTGGKITLAKLAFVDGRFVSRAIPATYERVDNCYKKFGERFGKIKRDVDAIAKDTLLSTAYRSLVMYLQDKVGEEDLCLFSDKKSDLEHVSNNKFDDLKISFHMQTLSELEFKVLILNCVASFKDVATVLKVRSYI